MAKVWRFIVTGTDSDSGQECVHNLHYQTDVPIAGTEPSADTVLDELEQHFSTSGTNFLKWANCATTLHTFTNLAVREEIETGSGDVPGAAAKDISIAGVRTAGSNFLPSAVCPWIRLKTASAIRSARGGVHLPPSLNEAVLEAHGVYSTSSSYWTNIVALGASIIDVLDDVFSTTGDIKPVIYSKTRRDRDESFTFDLTVADPSRQPRWLRTRQEF
jgi:hypothetical protein